MKKNQLIIGFSIVALIAIAIFVYKKQQKPIDTIVSTDTTSATTSQLNKTMAVPNQGLAVVYKFVVADNTTHRNWRMFVSLNSGAPTEIFKIGSGCLPIDGFNYVPVTIECPATGSKTAVTIDVYLRKSDSTLIKHEPTRIDSVASCSSPDFLLFSTPCGLKIRQYPTTPLSSKINVSVSEGPSETYDDIVTWPPTVH